MSNVTLKDLKAACQRAWTAKRCEQLLNSTRRSHTGLPRCQDLCRTTAGQMVNTSWHHGQLLVKKVVTWLDKGDTWTPQVDNHAKQTVSTVTPTTQLGALSSKPSNCETHTSPAWCYNSQLADSKAKPCVLTQQGWISKSLRRTNASHPVHTVRMPHVFGHHLKVLMHLHVKDKPPGAKPPHTAAPAWLPRAALTPHSSASQVGAILGIPFYL